MVKLVIPQEDEPTLSLFLTRLCMILRPELFDTATYQAWENLLEDEQEVTLEQWEAVARTLKKQEFNPDFDHWS